MNRKKAVILSLIFSIIFSVSGSETSGFQAPSLAVSTEVSAEKTVIPGGKCIGVALSTDGVLVVDVSDVVSSDGKHTSPAKDAGIKSGDLIQSFNGNEIESVSDLNTAINSSGGKASSVKLNRNGNIREVLITPKVSQSDGGFKIGAWVKDAASGIGTLTFYDPDTKSFAALGHGICDSETGNLLTVGDGNILSSSIVSIDKGEKGVPGELNGIFKDDEPILGKITDNNDCGIFGTCESNILTGTQTVPIADRDEVKLGSAYILANVEGNSIEKFDIEIIRIMPKAISSQKGMIIRITDEKLLNKTGGIVQGMSGSPVIQNGKLVGAVTHVFVNDPTRGYGIFIENMLAEAEKIK